MGTTKEKKRLVGLQDITIRTIDIPMVRPPPSGLYLHQNIKSKHETNVCTVFYMG